MTFQLETCAQSMGIIRTPESGVRSPRRIKRFKTQPLSVTKGSRAACRRRPKAPRSREDSMAPKPTKNRAPPSDPNGMFAGLVVFLVENGVQARRLQVSQSCIATNQSA